MDITSELIKIHQHIEKIRITVLDLQARQLALQAAIEIIFDFNKSQSEKFEQHTNSCFKTIYQEMLIELEKSDPELAAKLSDESDRRTR